ncbi:MAG: bifunctional [glutamate--ammonia ligase]-adenylyl-L-tyrosine phosphorylase/[glutamate--ammonia-ligase] adenylyltransferase, partial [Pseudomonadales bacterium]|nr:bifunctional [glutamate--ammonia ligase]-adenylyl-L-tyrosine phosphorylase/[glutamate--ammonia-ligase] adenylyltransferase [Pseudomonadales bacterium]
DKQTQQLPNQAKDKQRLAFAMGFHDVDAFQQAIDNHRQRVHTHFSALISAPDDGAAGQEESHECLQAMKRLWLDEIQEEEALALLTDNGFRHSENSWRFIYQLKTSRVVLGLQAESRQRLNQFIPLLLETLALKALSPTAQGEQPDIADLGLERVLPLVNAVLRRSAYLLLLIENPKALEQVVLLSAASPWIAEQLAKHPVLLDELLDIRTLFTLPDRDSLRQALLQQTVRIPPEDLEAHMEALRYFKLSHSLRVAACEVNGLLPLMKVSDYLTFMAEVILDHSLFLAWQHLTRQFGQPCNAAGELLDPGFIIIGYGKLGGLELGHSSDLDIVFVHDADIHQSTHGSKTLDNATFYARLGQRIIHILETRTPSGQLYEVDARLRPSGNSGMLVSSLQAFEKYQLNKAWTWEHQALVRARVVCGCPSLAEKFSALRETVLQQDRPLPALRKEVVEMRQKMRDHLGSKGDSRLKGGLFHIKHDAGAIVDIEFMVQYAVLAWARHFPGLMKYTDNIRILEQLPEYGILSNEEAQGLIDAYKTLRSAIHRLALQQLPATVGGEQFLAERAHIVQLWQKLLESPQATQPVNADE